MSVDNFYCRDDHDRRPPPPTDERATLSLLVAGLGIFMVFLDTQILFVAFGDIERSFPDVSTNAMSWVLSGYTLAFAALLVPAGRLADRWGRKRVFIGGLALFTVASAMCGLAPTAGLLIAARILQAVGAAAITPTSLALVLRATPRERVPIAVAVWGSMGAVAAAFGPTLGGLLVDAAGWRWVFFLNLPVCVVAIVLGRRVLVESKEADPGPFPDLVGSALLALGVGAVSLALVQSEDWGWVDARTIGSIVVGLVLTALFVAPLADAGVAGPRPVAVPHPELPLGQPGDRRLRPLVHGHVPRQRDVPDDRVGVGRRQGRPGHGAGADRRARPRPPLRPARRPHRPAAADHRRRPRRTRSAASCSSRPSRRRRTTRRRCCRPGC